MRTFLSLHILAGLVGLVAGYVALYCAKGLRWHRKSGRLFVYAMLPMALSGMLIAAIEGVAPAINIPAGAVTFYMVATAWMTVRPLAGRWRQWLRAGMVFSFVLGVSCVVAAASVIARGGRGAGMAYPLILFAIVAFSGSAGDRRMLRAGGLHGAARLRRHVWRIGFALFVAAGSFFLGQADEFPPAVRITPLLALPVLAVPATTIFWLRRLRRKADSSGSGPNDRGDSRAQQPPLSAVSTLDRRSPLENLRSCAGVGSLRTGDAFPRDSGAARC